jgi:Fe-S cluster assembly ATP-binding protein
VVETRRLAEKLGLPRDYFERELNKGFSGGEKKRSELLQVLISDPKIVILDEPDSGLDVDGVRLVASILRSLLDQGKGILLITHYTRMFQFIEPDRISVMYDGAIIAEGGMEIARRIDSVGYKGFLAEYSS